MRLRSFLAAAGAAVGIAAAIAAGARADSETERPWRKLAIDAGGSVTASTWQAGAWGPATALGLLDGADPAAFAKTRAAAQAFLMAAEADRGPDGACLRTLVVAAAPATPWRMLQWTLQIGCGPRLKIWQYTLALAGSPPLPVDLPQDLPGWGHHTVEDPQAPLFATAFQVGPEIEEHLEPPEPFGDRRARGRGDAAAADEPRGRTLKLKLFRRDRETPAKAYTLLRLGSEADFALPRGAGEARAATWTRLRAAIDRWVDGRREAGVRGLQAEVVAPPPKGGWVPYADVVRACHVLRDAGFRAIVFEGAAMPIPGR